MVTEIMNASDTSTHKTSVEDVEVTSLNILEVEDINEQVRNQRYAAFLEVLHLKKSTSYKQIKNIIYKASKCCIMGKRGIVLVSSPLKVG